jgi:hypothetical protein
VVELCMKTSLNVTQRQSTSLNVTQRTAHRA